MFAEPCSSLAGDGARKTLQILVLIILIATFVLLMAMAACETASVRPDIRCLVIVTGGMS